MAANKLYCTLAIGALLCLGFAALIQAQGELNKSEIREHFRSYYCFATRI